MDRIDRFRKRPQDPAAAANGLRHPHGNGGSTRRRPRRAEAKPAGGTRLHELFEARADHAPDALAVVHGAERRTYGELERDANRVARWLRTRGVVRGSRVGLLLPRSTDLYAAMLGILKAGAAYVPIDPECPAERAATMLADAKAAALVTSAALGEPLAGFPVEQVRVDEDRARIEAQSPERLAPGEAGGAEEDLCYIIFTSGSTGRPKGVMIEHRNAVHLVLTEAGLFRIRTRDRVYQGFTLAFDASVEEIWLALNAGATLVAATPEMARAGADLSRSLEDSGVTVLSCVPTLLEMLGDDVSTLRLLILGGEACPPGLVSRWARPGRRIVNTYGPTETTVIATCGDLRPGRPVTIGRAIPGYRVHLLDSRLRPVPAGEPGEIWIGGRGVARGYVNLPEQERERFVPEPAWLANGSPGRLYRTGDLARLVDGGEFEFLGRADTQVKLRGYRVELAEIESALLGADGVGAAACTVREDVPGVQQLVAYVVPARGEPDTAGLRARLRTRLPEYMVPAVIETVRDLPRLASGKLDRSALPAPRAHANGRPRGGRAHARGAGPAGTTERAIAQVWERLFPGQAVTRDADFFLDLGGHSLLAARAVSALRARPGFERVAMADLYRHRTVAALAAAFAGSEPREPERPEEAPARDAELARRHFLAGLFQAGGLYLVFGQRALYLAAPYFAFFLLAGAGLPTFEAFAWAAAVAVALPPLAVAGAIAAKWLLLGRVRPGRHRLWGAYHVRWWLAHTLMQGLHLRSLAGTPLLPGLFRLLGARIGRDVYFGTDHVSAFDLVSIGDGSSIDDEASLLGSEIVGGELVLGRVTVGRECLVGARSVLGTDTELGDGARLEDLSLLPRGGRIPAGETWSGSPARRSTAPEAPPARPPSRRGVAAVAGGALYLALALLLPLVTVPAIVPGMMILVGIGFLERPLAFLAAAPLVGASFVVLVAAEIALLKWLVVGRVRPGRHAVHGPAYMRLWVVERLMATSLEVIAPIHATLYVAPWYRALGARIGRLVELSTARCTAPDLLEVDDGGTIADEASIGEARVERGWLTMARARIGRRAFVGNSGVIPTGTALGDGALVGVLSIAPSDRRAAARGGAGWLGSPPIELPRREPSAGFREDRTYEPPPWLRLARGAFEIFRVTLPPAGFILVTAAVVSTALGLWESAGPLVTLLLLPVVHVACCAAALLAVALAKWLVVGRYRPFVRPLWTPFVWRLELVNALYEFFAAPLALDALRGTPFLPAYLRLLGARMGRRACLETTGFLEWDLVELGDDVVLNEDCVVQSHLFEDRMLKASRVRIGSRCTVGALSVVLYDSCMEPGATLEPLSLLMKGETLPSGTAWVGSPSIRACAAGEGRAGDAAFDGAA